MHHPRPAPVPRDASDASATATALLDVAERLFAEHGLAAVSLRQIVLASGQGNLSAAHYHFGSRDGLVRAVLARRLRVLDAARHRGFDAIEADGRAASLEAVIGVAVGVLAEVIEREPWGADYVRVLAQTMFETGLARVDGIDPMLFGSLDRAVTLARARLPDLPRAIFEARVERVHHEATQTLARWVRTHGRVDASNRRAFRAAARDLVAFLSAGLAAPTSPRLHRGTRR
ncbi:MAG: helix-turn-helix domain-containing protein [Burkholderiales bacterium]|jgi:AcrR family transcriptional regulator